MHASNINLVSGQNPCNCSTLRRDHVGAPMLHDMHLTSWQIKGILVSC